MLVFVNLGSGNLLTGLLEPIYTSYAMVAAEIFSPAVAPYSTPTYVVPCSPSPALLHSYLAW